MLQKSDAMKHYRSAKDRFIKPMIMKFFHDEFPKLFGPVIREKLADELLMLLERNCPPVTTLRTGQLFWNALDKHTRGDSPHRQFVPVVLTVVSPDDVEQLSKGVKPSVIAQTAIAPMIQEAYQQGGILSTRDLSLVMVRSNSYAALLRSRYEKKHDVILPHTGALHDMGSTVTHKAAIINKIVIQKKDPSVAARECNHSQRAVDRYLKDYHRVKTMYEHDHDSVMIHHVTGIAKHVVKQYINIIQQEHNLDANI